MLRALVLTFVALLVTAVPAQAAHCAPRKHDHVKARSPRAVVLVRETADQESDSITYTLIGCSRRTGARRVVEQFEEDFYGGLFPGAVRLNGTAMAYEVGFDDPKNGIAGGGSGDGDALLLHVSDAVHEVAPVAVGSDLTLAPGDLQRFTLGPHGEVAWAQARGALMLWTAREGTRLLDRAAVIGAPRIAGGRVAWAHDGSPMTAPLQLPRTQCNLDPADGTPELDIVVVHPSLLVVCRRASGVTLRVDVQPYDQTTLRPAFGGTYAAVRLADRVLVFDTVAGTVRTILTTVPGRGVAVDEHGDLAWPDRDADGRWRLWIEDGDGRRFVGDPGADTAMDVARDRAIVAWDTQTFTLHPPAP